MGLGEIRASGQLTSAHNTASPDRHRVSVGNGAGPSSRLPEEDARGDALHYPRNTTTANPDSARASCPEESPMPLCTFEILDSEATLHHTAHWWSFECAMQPLWLANWPRSPAACRHASRGEKGAG